MSMRTHLKNYLVPHENNDHKPHLLREASVLLLALILILLFGFSVFHASVIRNNADISAAVISSVLVDYTNEDRLDEGLGTLTFSPILAEAARLKAEHMAEHEYFAHQSPPPESFTPWYWLYRANYTFVHAGENLAVNFINSRDVSRAWMDSPGHRANILNPNFTEVGIATVPGTYKGRDTLFVVQFFGTPAQTAPQVAQTVPAVAFQPTPSEKAQQESELLTVTQPEEEKSDVESTESSVIVKEDTKDTTAVLGAYTTQSTAWERFLMSPQSGLKWGYILIGTLVSLVLLCMVFVQVRKQHSKNILYGVLLLVLIALLCYFNYLLISANGLIV